jgi:predicted thioesterase
MKESLKPGLIATKRFDIDLARTIDFLGEELRIYATPELVRDIEWTCRDFLLAYADEGEDSVGIGMDISHKGATPLDAWVEVEATVIGVEGRQVSFDVVVRDPLEEVGRGNHKRFMVDVAKLKQRVAGKVAKIRKA